MNIRWEKYLRKIGVSLMPFQVELAAKLLHFPNSAKVVQCRQSGKSFVMGKVSDFLARVLHWPIVITAPAIDQTWGIMQHVHSSQTILKEPYDYDNRYSIAYKGAGTITCLSGSETAKVESKGCKLLIVDEHQDMPAEYTATSFVPMLGWYDGLYWSSGIGGSPGSVALREDVEFEWELSWPAVIDLKPGYQRIVDMARREMMPEEFAAHYECKALDVSAHLLIPNISPTTEPIQDAHTVVGIDWGKRIDQTIATVVDQSKEMDQYGIPKRAVIKDWLLMKGDYAVQIEQLVKWLQNDVEYDEVIPELNGVGEGNTDILIAAMKDLRGFSSKVAGHTVDQKWNSDQAKIIARMCRNGSMTYNGDHPLAGVFKKDVTQLEYKMLDSDLIKVVDHSDFLSSLKLGMFRTEAAYL